MDMAQHMGGETSVLGRLFSKLLHACNTSSGSETLCSDTFDHFGQSYDLQWTASNLTFRMLVDGSTLTTPMVTESSDDLSIKFNSLLTDLKLLKERSDLDVNQPFLENGNVMGFGLVSMRESKNLLSIVQNLLMDEDFNLSLMKLNEKNTRLFNTNRLELNACIEAHKNQVFGAVSFVRDEFRMSNSSKIKELEQRVKTLDGVLAKTMECFQKSPHGSIVRLMRIAHLRFIPFKTSLQACFKVASESLKLENDQLDASSKIIETIRELANLDEVRNGHLQTVDSLLVEVDEVCERMKVMRVVFKLYESFNSFISAVFEFVHVINKQYVVFPQSKVVADNNRFYAICGFSRLAIPKKFWSLLMKNGASFFERINIDLVSSEHKHVSPLTLARSLVEHRGLVAKQFEDSLPLDIAIFSNRIDSFFAASGSIEDSSSGYFKVFEDLREFMKKQVEVDVDICHFDSIIYRLFDLSVMAIRERVAFESGFLKNRMLLLIERVESEKTEFVKKVSGHHSEVICTLNRLCYRVGLKCCKHPSHFFCNFTCGTSLEDLQDLFEPIREGERYARDFVKFFENGSCRTNVLFQHLNSDLNCDEKLKELSVPPCYLRGKAGVDALRELADVHMMLCETDYSSFMPLVVGCGTKILLDFRNECAKLFGIVAAYQAINMVSSYAFNFYSAIGKMIEMSPRCVNVFELYYAKYLMLAGTASDFDFLRGQVYMLHLVTPFLLMFLSFYVVVINHTHKGPLLTEPFKVEVDTVRCECLKIHDEMLCRYKPLELKGDCEGIASIILTWEDSLKKLFSHVVNFENNLSDLCGRRACKMALQSRADKWLENGKLRCGFAREKEELSFSSKVNHNRYRAERKLMKECFDDVNKSVLAMDSFDALAIVNSNAQVPMDFKENNQKKIMWQTFGTFYASSEVQIKFFLKTRLDAIFSYSYHSDSVSQIRDKFFEYMTYADMRLVNLCEYSLKDGLFENYDSLGCKNSWIPFGCDHWLKKSAIECFVQKNGDFFSIVRILNKLGCMFKRRLSYTKCLKDMSDTCEAGDDLKEDLERDTNIVIHEYLVVDRFVGWFMTFLLFVQDFSEKAVMKGYYPKTSVGHNNSEVFKHGLMFLKCIEGVLVEKWTKKCSRFLPYLEIDLNVDQYFRTGCKSDVDGVLGQSVLTMEIPVSLFQGKKEYSGVQVVNGFYNSETSKEKMNNLFEDGSALFKVGLFLQAEVDNGHCYEVETAFKCLEKSESKFEIDVLCNSCELPNEVPSNEMQIVFSRFNRLMSHVSIYSCSPIFGLLFNDEKTFNVGVDLDKMMKVDAGKYCGTCDLTVFANTRLERFCSSVESKWTYVKKMSEQFTHFRELADKVQTDVAECDRDFLVRTKDSGFLYIFAQIRCDLISNYDLPKTAIACQKEKNVLLTCPSISRHVSEVSRASSFFSYVCDDFSRGEFFEGEDGTLLVLPSVHEMNSFTLEDILDKVFDEKFWEKESCSSKSLFLSLVKMQYILEMTDAKTLDSVCKKTHSLNDLFFSSTVPAPIVLSLSYEKYVDGCLEALKVLNGLIDLSVRLSNVVCTRKEFQEERQRTLLKLEYAMDKVSRWVGNMFSEMVYSERAAFEKLLLKSAVNVMSSESFARVFSCNSDLFLKTRIVKFSKVFETFEDLLSFIESKDTDLMSWIVNKEKLMFYIQSNIQTVDLERLYDRMFDDEEFRRKIPKYMFDFIVEVVQGKRTLLSDLEAVSSSQIPSAQMQQDDTVEIESFCSLSPEYPPSEKVQWMTEEERLKMVEKFDFESALNADEASALGALNKVFESDNCADSITEREALKLSETLLKKQKEEREKLLNFVEKHKTVSVPPTPKCDIVETPKAPFKNTYISRKKNVEAGLSRSSSDTRAAVLGEPLKLDFGEDTSDFIFNLEKRMFALRKKRIESKKAKTYLETYV